MNNEEIFNLIKKQEFNKIYELIDNEEIKLLNIKDTSNIYFIYYIILYNQIKILKLIYDKKYNIRLDFLDIDGRSILYNCIKLNYIEILNLLILYNKNNIGMSIINIKDKLGYTPLHFCIFYNNFEAFKILLQNGGNPYLEANDNTNIFVNCLIYKKNNMLDYLIDNKYNIDFISHNNETLLQIALKLNNNYYIDKLLEYNINLNNQENNFGLSIFHQSIINDKYELFERLLNKNININLSDRLGCTGLHYIFIYNKLNFLELLVNNNDLNFNIGNVNGDLPIHILLQNNIDLNKINSKILDKIILESDLNYQNNNGTTPLMIIVQQNLVQQFKNLLVLKQLNFFIKDNESNNIKMNDEILNIIVDSYYNQIKLRQNELIDNWELDCFNGKLSEQSCKKKIKEFVLKENKSFPTFLNTKLKFDSGIFINQCQYTGSRIDILFGLILLYNEFKLKGLRVVLDYPLTINTKITDYLRNIGVESSELDFFNIEIYWCYQKLFFPSFFYDEINKLIKEDAKYIVIPIAIENSIGAHANILFWDIKNNTIERFEPHGAHAIEFNYNSKLLDNLLENKFKEFNNDIIYYKPHDFLPFIGFQTLESLETDTCRKIGDPNGFCGVWTIWWVYQRMTNINNKQLSINNIANELIKYIKLNNNTFKTIIRNFSIKITDIRDSYLKNVGIDINDWIVKNYNENIINTLEKNIIKIF